MKSILLKNIFFLLFFFVFKCGYCQTAITITSCDTTISEPSINLPQGAYVLTIKSASNTRMSYNVEQFNQNYGNVFIYDGPTTAAPLITTLTDPFIPNQKLGAQSSGASITISFFTAGPASTLAHFKIRFRCVQTPSNYPKFQPLPALPAGGTIQSADYDVDGDPDLLIGGKIYRNDSYFDTAFKFERKGNVLNGWNFAKMCSADFNNDGFKDIFITGSTSVLGGLLAPHAAIYKNNGNGTFSLVTSQSFEGANRGGCSIVDFNNDGKPDICYTGSTHYYLNSSRIFKLYLNNGNFGFTDAAVSLPGVTGLVDASIDWADGDGDGDKDLVINGHNGSANVAGLFTVSGNTFTNTNLSIAATSNGAIMWADVNMDGKPDIANRGVATPGNINAIVPELFINAGNNNFTRTATNLPALYGGGMDWTDYDGDHDMDIVIDGVKPSVGNGINAGLYKNNGSGQFSKININGINGDSRIKWFDFNNDGRQDIIVAGAELTGTGGYFIKNMGADSFRIASLAITGNKYNEAAVCIEDFNNDGKIDILITEGLVDVDCNANNSSALVLGKAWLLSGVPKLTEVADLNTVGAAVPGQYNDFSWTWGDFDSDGQIDVLAIYEAYNTYFSPEQNLRMFKNNGNNNFTAAFNSQTASLPHPQGAGYTYFQQTTLFDIDNDGKNELFLPVGNTVYKRVNNQWVFSYSDFQTMVPPGYIPGCAAAADYNKDGFMDMVVAWRYYTAGGGTGGGGLTFFKNNGQGRLVVDAAQGLNYITTTRQVKWTDIDNDGDPDLLADRFMIENRNGIFVPVHAQLLPVINAGIGDFNGDGYNDIVNISTGFVYGSVKMYYNEQGSCFFNEQEAGQITNTTGTQWSQSAVGLDIDNDGDDDITYSAPLCNTGATILINESNINSQSIHVVSPNGGENYTVNTSQTIKWYGNLVGSTVKIELSKDSGTTWQTIAAAAPSSAGGGSYTWNTSNPVSVKCLVKITDNSNTSFTDKSNFVFTISVPSIPVANAGRDSLLCLGSSVQIGTASVGNNVYAWTSNNGSFSSSIANPVVSPVSTTSYYLTVTNGSLTAKDTVVITVSMVPANVPDTLLQACTGRSYNIGVPAQQGLIYQWTSVPAGFTSMAANPVIVAAGNIYYYLTVRNTATGCSNTATVHVIADSCSVNGIIIFPNPANTQITIQLEQGSSLPAEFILYNTGGTVVLNKNLVATITTVDVSNQPSGLYFYIIRSSSGQILRSGSLVIQH